ncbi:MAG: segregation/condensation protein A [Chitinophagales bacterium]|nr:segregation/condensation protein A [Chitinophagales bacterium]MCO5280240.1 segregation/condensation protein A [Chitinophagales bacterium]OJV25248.1 MAG: chromosome segregation protein ScpA [Bacteroidetes bacterium 37-13]HRP39411.1 segregation/condensation protein A [Chitinophagales bacterium]
MSEIFSIKLPQFEGPFDLLLFFIERDELDIYDIPISKITDDFLSYIHNNELLNIEVASEFILVAATLMRIKAKLLLPRKELDEQGKEIDPREELANRLIEYKKYKEVSEALRLLEDDRQSITKRGNAASEIGEIASAFETDHEMQSLTMLRLMKAFQNVITRLDREKHKVVHTVLQPPYTISGEKMILLEKVNVGGQTTFEEVFEDCENRIHAMFTFLSMLELIQEKLIGITIGEGYNNFWITKYTAEQTAALNTPEIQE